MTEEQEAAAAAEALKLKKLTYLPDVEDPDEVNVGGITFTADVPVELDDVTASKVLHLVALKNPWFHHGDNPPKSKKALDALEKAKAAHEETKAKLAAFEPEKPAA